MFAVLFRAWWRKNMRLANKVLVLTLPALCNFGIIARCYGFVVAQAAYFRSKARVGRTTQALALRLV